PTTVEVALGGQPVEYLLLVRVRIHVEREQLERGLRALDFPRAFESLAIACGVVGLKLWVLPVAIESLGTSRAPRERRRVKGARSTRARRRAPRPRCWTNRCTRLRIRCCAGRARPWHAGASAGCRRRREHPHPIGKARR